MNTKQFFEKTKEVVKKVSKKTWIASAAVLIIGIAVLLNVLFMPSSDKENSGVIDPALDLSDVSATISEKENKSSTQGVDAFAEMSLSRQQARDEAMEVLKTLANSETATDAAKQEAYAEIENIASCIENEANIESLIKSKGFEECVAVISDGSASVIVKTDGLAQNQIAQISEIVYQQAGILPSNLNIIESK